MPLTVTEIRNAKPRRTPYKLFDGEGMYLLVNPDGSRYWRLKYYFASKEKAPLSFGVYPRVSLAEARDRRAEAKRDLRDGVDPGAKRKAAKRAAKLAAKNSFQAVAEEWITKRKNPWAPGHAKRVRSSLEANLFPDLGRRPIKDIEAPELLDVLRKIESRGSHEVRQRVQERTSAIFRYAIANGHCTRNPAADLRGAFTTPARGNHAALAEKDLPAFFEKVATYDGEPVTKLALRMLVLTFVRTGELRGAEWSEFDEDKAEWRIPAERMKMREQHIVPLSRQVLALLAELRPLTGTGRYVFPHRTNSQKTMSNNTILYALYRMGYHSRATGHGFRATASTVLNEQGFKPDVIERQLAHVERSKVRAAYNKAQYLPERRQMMQHWADFLDQLAKGDRKVVSGKFRKAAA